MALAFGRANVARAEDWLARLAPCATDASLRPELSLVYPRPGLPSVVGAGELLIARVRVPAALTPPPGVQQERVLRAWGAELVGDGIVLAAKDAKDAKGANGAKDVALAHHYGLPATNLRPDTGASLVYRISLAVPAYARPGSYDLVLRTPFGVLRSDRAVAVIARGAVPRIARAPAGMQTPSARMSVLPVDVWIMQPAAAGVEPPPSAAVDVDLDEASAAILGAQHAQPWLAAEVSGVALRAGAYLLLGRQCAAEAHDGAEVAALLQAERRTPLPLTAAQRSPVQAPFVSVLAAPDPGALRVSREGSALTIDNGATDTVVLSILLERGLAPRVTAAELDLYPATEVRFRRALGIVARVRVAPHAHARVELMDYPLDDELSILPRTATAGRPLRLHVQGAEPDAHVAFDLDPTETAWAGPVLTRVFAAPGAHHLSALVISHDGSTRAARGELWVVPEKPATSCAVVAPGTRATMGPTGFRSAVSALLLFAAVRLLKRRALPRFGNRLPR